MFIYEEYFNIIKLGRALLYFDINSTCSKKELNRIYKSKLMAIKTVINPSTNINSLLEELKDNYELLKNTDEDYGIIYNKYYELLTSHVSKKY